MTHKLWEKRSFTLNRFKQSQDKTFILGNSERGNTCTFVFVTVVEEWLYNGQQKCCTFQRFIRLNYCTMHAVLTLICEIIYLRFRLDECSMITKFRFYLQKGSSETWKQIRILLLCTATHYMLVARCERLRHNTWNMFGPKYRWGNSNLIHCVVG